jgi:hypothetical protein
VLSCSGASNTGRHPLGDNFSPADLVVPELQRRGRFRTKYTGSTLRENLLDS